MTSRSYAALAASAFLIAAPAFAQDTQSPQPSANPVVLTTPAASDAQTGPMPQNAAKPAAGKSGCNWSKRATS